MEEALSFFRAFEVWIYMLLALGGLIYVRKFILAWQELRESAFGLERESAQARLNHSASVLVLLLTMAVTEFVLVSFVAPTVPGATPLPTSTLDLLATPTFTLPPTLSTEQEGQITTVTPAPILSLPGSSGCQAGQIEITSPQDGQEVSGVVDVLGTADIPNFGFFKLEMKTPDVSDWQTITAGNKIVQSGLLGRWDTSRLIPGEYQLGLVLVDNQAHSSPPCAVQLRVSKPPEGTPGP